jgi:peptidoglycan lytic transglycosylase
VRLAFALLLALFAASCHRPPPTNPHYVLGAPYQAGGVWYYPREMYEGQETGLAAVYPSDHADLTADGEAFDQTALAAAHQTVQLPAIVRLTNLENGLQTVVRINDRGPVTPHRVVEVTRRTATLLRFQPDAAVRVRLEVLPAESHAAVEAMPDAPQLELAAAPRGEVEQTDLPPPGSTELARPTARAAQPQEQRAAVAEETLRLPEVLLQGAPDPGQLFVRLGTFQSYEYANIQRARVGGLGASIVTIGDGRRHVYRVTIGPLSTVARADMVLDQVLRSGVTDARIVVE